MKTEYCGLSDMGCVRTNNEDAFYVAPLEGGERILAMAIDGVGGYEGGEVAAEITRDCISGVYASSEQCQMSLRNAMIRANNEIVNRSHEDLMLSMMSCVATAAIIDLADEKIEMAHVGDTRLYQYYDGTLEKLSHDHSLVGYREEIGELTEEEAMHHPQRNIISKVLGSDPLDMDSDYVETAEFPLIPNSTLLFCSDGLCDMITSSEICEVLSLDVPLEEKAQRLIEAANNAGGKDNVTVVLVNITDDDVSREIVEEGTTYVVDTPKKPKRIKWLAVLLAAIVALVLAAIVAYLLVFDL